MYTGVIKISGVDTTVTASINSNKDLISIFLSCTFNESAFSKSFNIRNPDEMKDVITEFRDYVISQNQKINQVINRFVNRGFSKVVVTQ